jgi:RNA polymerase sigma-70 factor (ECF subfamily)
MAEAATPSRIRASVQLVQADMSPLFLKRLSDERLGSRLASGEAAAFDELYRRYAHRLAAYGSHLLGDAASGDDVAQATMLKAYAALRNGRVPDHMKSWLFRIAHNAAIDLVVRRRELPSEDLPETASVDPEPFAGALVEALAMLPDRQRRVYLLREVHGLRIDETAAELGLTASQVEQSLFVARNRLAEQLVFGDRLNCVTVQRLAVGPLDAPERRALKTHLRSCGECRQTVGLRGRALTLFPSAWGLEWLRGLGAGLVGGGAPAAAKVGAIFATATVAAGVPVAVEHSTTHLAHRPSVRLVDTATAVPPRASVPATRAVAVDVVARHGESSSHGERQKSRKQVDVSTETQTGGRGSGEPQSSSESSHDGGTSPSGSGDDHTGVLSGGSGESGSGTVSGSGGSGSFDGGRETSGRDGGAGFETTDTSMLHSDGGSGGSTSIDGGSSGSGDGSTSGSDDHSGGSTITTSSTTTSLDGSSASAPAAVTTTTEG